MKREETVQVGIVAEKRAPRSKWADESWLPVAVMPAQTTLADGAELVRGDGFVRYFLGSASITLHAKEAEAYKHNLESSVPALYVVLRESDNGPLPVGTHCVTASPYEAQDYMDTGEDIVERVAVPDALVDWIAQFVETHYVEEPFRKRKRDRIDIEDVKFGKEPIFTRGPGSKREGRDV